MWKKDKRVYAAGFILIGFFIRNLVKRNVKNGPKQQQQREKKCIINYTSARHTNTCTQHGQRPNRNQRKFALHFFLRVLCVALLFIQYYFQKGCRCIRELNNAKKQICERAYNNASFQISVRLIQKCHVILYIETYKQIRGHRSINWLERGNQQHQTRRVIVAAGLCTEHRANARCFMINPYTPRYVHHHHRTKNHRIN